MFQELMNSIWEEFARVIFHVEVEHRARPGRADVRPSEARRGGDVQYSGGAGEEQPSALREAQAGGGATAAGRAAPRRPPAGGQRRSGGDQPGDGRQGRATRRSAATIPAGAARARSTRSATAPSAITASAENLAAAERLLAALRERDRDGIAAELHPEVVARGDKGSVHRGRRRGRLGEAVRRRSPRLPGARSTRLREVGDDHVAVDARRQWRWKETDELADESPLRRPAPSSATAASTAGGRTSPRSSRRSTRSEYAGRMAEAPSTEAVSSRIAEIREQLDPARGLPLTRPRSKRR